MLQLPFTNMTLVDYRKYRDKLECKKYYIAVEFYHTIKFYHILNYFAQSS